MGGALLSQWVRLTEFHFTVVDPAVSEIPPGAHHVARASTLEPMEFDALVIAIKPQFIDRVLPDYANKLTGDGFVLSIAAGFSVAGLKTHLPSAPFIRVMPNLPAGIGKGMSALYADALATDGHKDSAATLMKAVGSIIWVNSEDKIDRFTAVAGSGPGFVFELARVYVNAATELGFSSDDARRLVLTTFLGSAEMALKSGQNLESLRNSVTSKNGTTEAGLKSLNGNGELTRLVEATLRNAYKRAVELR
ncbi:MAG: pyrroline-5-carboxylate reductase [Hyphomonadaceae bacterium]|nr:pyrroline-5-carboxylate reductase [Hyphomonadaceae bacterium]MBC6412809.1 pyrroline-5-carboxylate reductase [Hyphomonadaceae bacterium]